MTTAEPGPRAPKLIPPGAEYHQVLVGERRRIGRGLLAIFLLVGGMFTAIVAFSYLGGWVDEILDPGVSDEVRHLRPLPFAAGLVATALVIPWSMLIQRWLYGVSGASLHSVVSRFRFYMVGKVLLVVGAAFAIALAITEFMRPGEATVWSQNETMGLLVVVLLLVPLQAAGEEYGFRGLVFRVAASWGRGRMAQLLLGLAVSSVVFAVIHTASDPWWNVLYVVFAVTTGLITWRTGGIELAVIIHAVYNTLNLVIWIALHADLDVRFDRSAGSASAALLIPSCLVLIAAAVVIWIRTLNTGPARTPSSEPPAARADRPASVSATTGANDA
jgi:uncharacterized protein